MKKLLGLLLTVFALMFSFGPDMNTAEAARVAVLPLQMDNLKQDSEDMGKHDYNSLYWDEATDLFKFPSFDLMGDDEVQKALPAEGLKDYSQVTLKSLANKLECDIIFAMQLDEITSTAQSWLREPTEILFMSGKVAYYNRISGKYKLENIYEKNEVEEALLVRGDWRTDLFGKTTRRYMQRAMALK